MDYELLFCLWFLWTSSTLCLFTCAFMWLWNRGEAFHPHSVALERRHALYQVVCSNTVCKKDFAVKSVSEFIAPRGSSSDKYLTILIIIGSVAGFLGSNRWYAVGDATYFQASLAQAGCFFLFIVALFEVDVSPRAFLEIKLMITSWFLHMLDTKKHLRFELSQYSEEMLKFLVESEEISHLYDEYTPDYRIKMGLPVFEFHLSMHMLGAFMFVLLVTASIILNEWEEERVGWITSLTFVSFSAMGYVTGSYLPVDPYMRGTILLWNPFIRERDFLIKLQRAVNVYCAKRDKQQQQQQQLVAMVTEEPETPRVNIDEVSEITATNTSNRSRDGSIRVRVRSPVHINSRSGTPRRRRTAVATATVDASMTQASPDASSPKRTRSRSANNTVLISGATASIGGVISEAEMQVAKDRVLRDNFFIRYASRRPKMYLRVLSHTFMVVELASLMTPLIAMGIQWTTALCGSTPPTSALWHLFTTIGVCLWSHDYTCAALQESCVVATNVSSSALA